MMHLQQRAPQLHTLGRLPYLENWGQQGVHKDVGDVRHL